MIRNKESKEKGNNGMIRNKELEEQGNNGMIRKKELDEQGNNGMIRNKQGWATVLFKRTFQSLRSFPFFIKEPNDLCVLFRSL